MRTRKERERERERERKRERESLTRTKGTTGRTKRMIGQAVQKTYNQTCNYAD